MQSKINSVNKQPPQALPIRRNQRNNDPTADTTVFDHLNLSESSNSVRPEEVQVSPKPEQEQAEASDPLGLFCTGKYRNRCGTVESDQCYTGRKIQFRGGGGYRSIGG